MTQDSAANKFELGPLQALWSTRPQLPVLSQGRTCDALGTKAFPGQGNSAVAPATVAGQLRSLGQALYMERSVRVRFMSGVSWSTAQSCGKSCQPVEARNRMCIPLYREYHGR